MSLVARLMPYLNRRYCFEFQTISVNLSQANTTTVHVQPLIKWRKLATHCPACVETDQGKHKPAGLAASFRDNCVKGLRLQWE